MPPPTSADFTTVPPLLHFGLLVFTYRSTFRAADIAAIGTARIAGLGAVGGHHFLLINPLTTVITAIPPTSRPSMRYAQTTVLMGGLLADKPCPAASSPATRRFPRLSWH